MLDLQDLRKAKKQFYAQRGNARNRNIEWKLSIEEYCQVWLKSGLWDKRGKGKGKYVMSRKGDIGPYSLDNVFVQSWEQNTRDAFSDPTKLEAINHKRKIAQIGIPRSFYSV